MIAYAISDPSTLHFNTLEADLRHFVSLADMILYRDKTTPNYAQNARQFLVHAKGFKRVLLHRDYILAAELGADGVHLTSSQLDEIPEAKALNLFVIVSTHTLKEAKKAAFLGTDMLTFSPIFDTPNKGEAKGVDALKEVVDSVDTPVIALGGIITEKQRSACQRVGAKGFASIRYFERKSRNSL